MRILFIHRTLGSFGGAESNVFATAGALRRRGHTVGLVAERTSGKGESVWHDLFAKNLSWAKGGDSADLARSFVPDVIYIHKWEHLACLEALLKCDTPLIRMVHDHDMYCLRSYRYNPLTRRICTRPAGAHCLVPCLATVQRKRGGGLPVRWVSLSEKQRELALSRRFALNVVANNFMKGELLLNGFDPARIEICAPAPAPAEPVRSSFSERNLLLFTGQIIRGKGVDVLLRALAKVESPFEALILGEGNHRAKCEKLCRRLGLERRVAFKGFIPPEELRGFYREATAVLVPSVWPEPMGLVGLEAMRNALPVVAFDAGGVSDWLRDLENGFLVPWMDTDVFARRIDDLLKDKRLARTMGESGQARASRDFDFQDYISRLEELFGRAARGRRKEAA